MDKNFYFQLKSKMLFLAKMSELISDGKQEEEFVYFIKSGLIGLTEDIDAYTALHDVTDNRKEVLSNK